MDVWVDKPRDEVVPLGVDLLVAARERRVGRHGDDDPVVDGDPAATRPFGGDDACVAHDEVDGTR